MQITDRRILGFPVGLGLLAITHLLNDMPAGMLPIVLLYQRQTLALSLAQVGFVAGIYNFCLALAQPLFGHLADRYGARRFATGGVVWGVILAGAVGFAPSFNLLIVIVSLAAIGSAAFHPCGFAGAGQIASSRRGLNMSIFLVGGTLGHALGPFVAGTIFQTTGLHGTAWIALAILMLVLGPALLMPLAEAMPREASPSALPPPGSRPSLWARPQIGLWLGAVTILFVGGVRTWIHWGLSTYIPQHLVALGFSAAEASGWLSIFLVALSIGTIIGGPLADYLGGRVLMVSSFAGLVGAIALLARPIGLPVGLLIGLAGLLNGLPLSMIIIAGQSLLPKRQGLASGVVIGSSFVLGATGVTLTGLIADQWGLATGFMTMGGLALMIAGLVTFFLPKESAASQT